MTIESSSRFDRIKKLDRDYWYCHVLSLVCSQPWNTTWHCFYPMDPNARAKIAGIVNKVYWCIFSFQGVGKNKIADRFLHLLNRPREYIQLHRYKAVFKSYTRRCPANCCQSHKMFFLFELNVTDNRLALSSPRHRRAGIKHLQRKLAYKTKAVGPFEKSPIYCQFLSKKEMNFCDDVQSGVFTINQLMNYECPALLPFLERDHHTGDYVSCCVRTVCGLFDDLPNFSVNSIGRGVRFINLMPKD